MKPFGHCNYKRFVVIAGKVEMFLSRVLCLSIATTLHHFDYFYKYTYETWLKTSSLPPPILTIPEELFIPITSFMDTESQFALAHTCTMLYKYHKQQCKEQTFTLLCDPQCEEYLISEYIKALERRMSQTGWISVKVTLEIASVKCSEQL